MSLKRLKKLKDDMVTKKLAKLKEMFTQENWKNYCGELFEDSIGALRGDPISLLKMLKKIKKSPTALNDALYLHKFLIFYNGVNNIDEDPAETIKLSTALFDDPKTSEDNAMRLLGYIDKADSKMKIQYYINATRSFLLNMIGITAYYRILKAISETLLEDLQYLSKIALRTDILAGNISLLALARAGLALQNGQDGNKNVESQYYEVSSLGRMVDQYAISFEDDDRRKKYKNIFEIPKLAVEPLDMPDKDIDDLFD